ACADACRRVACNRIIKIGPYDAPLPCSALPMTPQSQAATLWRNSPAFFRCLPFGVFIAVLALRGIAQRAGVEPSASYASQAGLTALLLCIFSVRGRYGELRSAPRSALAWSLTLAVGLGVFVVWINATLPWMRLSEPSATFIGRDPDGQLRAGIVAIRLAGATL